MMETKEWEYALCKGWIQKHVARGKDKPERIVKSIKTVMTKGHIDQSDLQKMIDEVHSESVMPFLHPPRNQQERLKRFHLIEEAFSKKASVRRDQ